MSLWLVTAYFPVYIAAGSFRTSSEDLLSGKRIPPNNFDSHFAAAAEEIDGMDSVGDHSANGFVNDF